MSKPIIEINGLGKLYRIGARRERYLSLRDEMAGWLSPRASRERAARSQFWALRDVDLSVQEGEAVGIIGRNGAGKSTLLKVLSQITPPTEGKITLRGRVASLLEVGTGFHPELTGRENIYLNGAILGMTRREIKAKFDEIVDFAEIPRFLDTPVKRYSSGMYVRLAFAVAAHIESEILLVDEVLAVGDVEFQRKCLGKMAGVAKSGRTLMFVSHNMGAIAELCGRCVQLSLGRVASTGPAKEVITDHLAASRTGGSVQTTGSFIDRTGDGPMRVTYVTTSDAQGHARDVFEYGEPIEFRIGIRGTKGKSVIAAVSLRNGLGQVILHLHSSDGPAELRLPSDESELRVSMMQNILADDNYYVTVWLGDGMNILNDRVGNCLSFGVDSSAQGICGSRGLVRANGDWSLVASTGDALLTGSDEGRGRP